MARVKRIQFEESVKAARQKELNELAEIAEVLHTLRFGVDDLQARSSAAHASLPISVDHRTRGAAHPPQSLQSSPAIAT
eukprot:3952084-Pleurochrysis_carterae.AAC.1